MRLHKVDGQPRDHQQYARWHISPEFLTKGQKT